MKPEIETAVEDLMLSDGNVKQAILRKVVESDSDLSSAFNKVVDSYIDFVKQAKAQSNNYAVVNIAPLVKNPAIQSLPMLPICGHTENKEIVGDMFLNMIDHNGSIKDEIDEWGEVVKQYHKLLTP